MPPSDRVMTARRLDERRRSARPHPRAASCSQTRTTRQPALRARHRPAGHGRRSLCSFSSHHALLLFGMVPCCGQLCQKHPSTNTATRARRKSDVRGHANVRLAAAAARGNGALVGAAPTAIKRSGDVFRPRFALPIAVAAGDDGAGVRDAAVSGARATRRPLGRHWPGGGAGGREARGHGRARRPRPRGSPASPD